MKLVSVAEMMAIEKEANAGGLSYEEMMENAGGGLAQVVAEAYGELLDEGVLALVGSGNNGGDALVALALLASEGWTTSAYIVRPRPADDPLVARLAEAGGGIFHAGEDPQFEQLNELLRSHAVLLDGVLGTGFRLPLKGEVAQALEAARQCLATMEGPPAVVAVDCPSGVDCDNGQAAAECIPADLTVTMAAIKQGLLKFPAYNLVGELRLVGIGLPEEGEAMETWRAVRNQVVDEAMVRSALPPRPADAHKGSFGTALIVAGSLSYTGAALLAGEAAYRAGAGLVTLAVPEPLHAALAGRFPEATWVLLSEEGGFIHAEALKEALEALPRATALLVGPGLGTEATTGQFVNGLLLGGSKGGRGGVGFVPVRGSAQAREARQLPPVVVDADGLKLLASTENWARLLPGPAILTPHPGEMSILTGLDKGEIQADRLNTAIRFAQEWGHVVILKGAFTVVAEPGGQAVVVPVATAALARAGTGDVLAGLAAGLLAQGVPPFEAAYSAAWIHGQAGLQAALALGNSASVLAGDVLEGVVEILSQLYADEF